MIAIVNYTPQTSTYIKTLNVEWLQKYFSVEPIDELQLSDPQTQIIDKGGVIFYATYFDQIVGTATLLFVEPGIYELGKMAITETHKGKGIANFLMQHCLDTARNLQAHKIILFSNTLLKPAIQLYRKFGFEEVAMTGSHYSRSNIKMEITLLQK